MDRFQKTLRSVVHFHGIGLHSGRPVHVAVHPAVAGHGVVFQRVDLPGAEPIPAHARRITACALSTTIGWQPGDRNSVATIEHLMAALAGLGIDNALIQIDGPEVPIMDGSAAPFVDAFLAAGVVRLAAHRRLLRLRKSFEVRLDDKLVRAEPADGRFFDCTIDFRESVIGRQSIGFELSRSSFLGLCGARTFCNAREVEAMRRAGLALGGSLENAVVVTESGVMNPEGLRSRDEFVRHKLLDSIGDLALLGVPLLARITLAKPGHALHAEFMNRLLDVASDHLVEETMPMIEERRAAMSEAVVELSAAAALV